MAGEILIAVPHHAGNPAPEVPGGECWPQIEPSGINERHLSSAGPSGKPGRAGGVKTGADDDGVSRNQSCAYETPGRCAALVGMG